MQCNKSGVCHSASLLALLSLSSLLLSRLQIFVGPCESSVFVRTSSHLKLVIAAQQLR